MKKKILASLALAVLVFAGARVNKAEAINVGENNNCPAAWAIISSLGLKGSQADTVLRLLSCYSHNEDYSALNVITPNGGENWQNGGSYRITWSYRSPIRADDMLYFYLDYDSGITCSLGTSPARNGGEGLPVGRLNVGQFCLARENPYTSINFPSGPARVRVVNMSNGTLINDVSDDIFTINASVVSGGSLTLISPNGGENIRVGSSYPVTWKSANLGNLTVSLDLMDRNGRIVRNLAQNIKNTGNYRWKPDANISAGSYRLVVSSFDKGPTAQDWSDNYFTIKSVGTNNPTVSLWINDQKTTGGEYGVPVNLGSVSTVTIRWQSRNTDYCNTYGQSSLRLKNGESWDIKDLPTSGSRTFYTTGQYNSLGSLLQGASIGIQCWKDNVDTRTDAYASW